LGETSGEALKRISEGITTETNLIQEISAAMEEQSAGANEIVSAVTSVVDSTQSIKGQTDEQADQSEKIQEVMEKLVQASNQINSSTAEQRRANEDIMKMINAIRKTVGENGEIVESLNNLINRFRIETKA
jgi:methyl-accepting chemotaxis protein